MQAAYIEPNIVRATLSPTRSLLAPQSGNPRLEEMRDTVYLIDQSVQVQNELLEMLRPSGLSVVGFTSAADYRVFNRKDTAACLVLDHQTQDIDGLSLQSLLMDIHHPPVIVVSGECSIRSTVSAMKAGAFEFLIKPVAQTVLIAAISAALVQDRKTRQRRAETAALQQRLSRLTPREREVLPLVVGGLLNKQAASLLDISEVTLQIHRSQIMKKMKAESFADLVRMAIRLRIPHWT